MAFIQYAMQIIMAFLMIAMMSIMHARVPMLLQNVSDEVLSTEPTIHDPESDRGLPVAGEKGTVEFDHVSFRLSGGR